LFRYTIVNTLYKGDYKLIVVVVVVVVVVVIITIIIDVITQTLSADEGTHV